VAGRAVRILQHEEDEGKDGEEGGIHGEPVGPDQEASLLHLAGDMNDIS